MPPINLSASLFVLLDEKYSVKEAKELLEHLENKKDYDKF